MSRCPLLNWYRFHLCDLIHSRGRGSSSLLCITVCSPWQQQRDKAADCCTWTVLCHTSLGWGENLNVFYMKGFYLNFYYKHRQCQQGGVTHVNLHMLSKLKWFFSLQHCVNFADLFADNLYFIIFPDKHRHDWRTCSRAEDREYNASNK